MSEPAPIELLIDEHLFSREMRGILVTRGHSVFFVEVGMRDQGILASAEQTGRVIISADR